MQIFDALDHNQAAICTSPLLLLKSLSHLGHMHGFPKSGALSVQLLKSAVIVATLGLSSILMVDREKPNSLSNPKNFQLIGRNVHFEDGHLARPRPPNRRLADETTNSNFNTLPIVPLSLKAVPARAN